VQKVAVWPGPYGAAVHAWLERLVHRLLAAMTEPDPTSPVTRGLRALILLGVIAAFMLAPVGLNARVMTVVIGVIFLLALCAVGGFTAIVARVANRATAGRQITLLGITVDAPELAVRPARAAEAVGLVIRRTGLALPALMFFFGWALLYSVLWLLDQGACSPDTAIACTHAFRGAGHDPTFGDFLYLSVNEAFANPPPDFFPASRLARTATTMEVLTGVLGVTVFAGAFFGVREKAKSLDAGGAGSGAGAA
jgi:hypothetical protein